MCERYKQEIKLIFVSNPIYGDIIIDKVYDRCKIQTRSYIDMIIRDHIEGQSTYECYKRLVTWVIKPYQAWVKRNDKIKEMMKNETK